MQMHIILISRTCSIHKKVDSYYIHIKRHNTTQQILPHAFIYIGIHHVTNATIVILILVSFSKQIFNIKKLKINFCYNKLPANIILLHMRKRKMIKAILLLDS